MNIEVSAVVSNDDPLYVNVLAVRESIQAQQNTNFFLNWNWIGYKVQIKIYIGSYYRLVPSLFLTLI